MRPKKMIQCLTDLPEMPGTIDTMAWNKTGNWRYLAPTPLRRTPPCREQCPAGMPIPDFIAALKKGKADEALSLIMTQNPLPGLTGRLCYHPCQTRCLRRGLDQNVLIQRLERFAADADMPEAPTVRDSGLGSAAVFGSGPFGLACAYFLSQKGIAVTVIDVNDRAGGDLLQVDPTKLDRRVLERDIARLVHRSNLDLQLGQEPCGDDPPALSGDYRITILDPTASGMARFEHAFPETFRPLEEEGIEGRAIKIALPGQFTPFKPSRISHYIGAARVTAEQIHARWNGSFEPGAEPLRLDENMVRLERFEKKEPLESAGDTEWDLETARAAADRCLSCGVCNQCGQCELFCPDQSIRLNGVDLEVDLYYCKGCGICANECPRGVITMEHDNL